MAKKLIRTVKVTEVTLKAVNNLTESVEELLLEVPGEYKDDKALEKAVKKNLPDSITLMYIKSSTVVEHKYTITEAEFLAHATKVN